MRRGLLSQWLMLLLSEFSPFQDFVKRLSCKRSVDGFGVCVGVADGYDDGGFDAFGQVESCSYDGGVEVAYPARSDSEGCGCEADVFGGDGYVDGCVVFAVVAVPCLVVVDAADDECCG